MVISVLNMNLEKRLKKFLKNIDPQFSICFMCTI